MRGLHVLINFQAIHLNPSPKKPLFLRYLPYIVNAASRKATGHGKGEGEFYKNKSENRLRFSLLMYFTKPSSFITACTFF